MELDNFYLKFYDNDSLEHQNIIRMFMNDKDSKYLGDLFYQIQVIERRREENFYNRSYIAYYQKTAVGYISLTYKDEEDIYEIAIGIIPKYRGQYLGSMLLQEFSNAILKKFSRIDKLTLKIKKENKASRRAAFLAGYEEEEDRITHTMRRH